MKKIFLLTLFPLLLLATNISYAGKAAKYIISKEGGTSAEYDYTGWPALMAQVKTNTGTATARVTVTITGNDFDDADGMPYVNNYHTIVCADDNVPYTTFKFVNCTFAPSVADPDKYDCLSFGYAIAPGIVLEFHGCTLNERLYGNEAGNQEGTHYTVDAKFFGCTFTSAATGGRHFGDLLFDGCTFTNRVSWENTEPVINAQNGTDAGCRRVNSVGGESTFTVKDCTFDQPITDASWLRFIYAVDFENYDIDIDQYFYPCLSDKFNFDKISDYNTDKLNTGRVKKLENLSNNATSSSKINFLAFVPARVRYDANAPESATASGETKDDNMYEAGENFTVKTNGFTCLGYKFKGWNTLANPTEAKPGTAYTEGQTAQIPLTIGFKLYAQWEELGPFLVVRTDTQYPTLQQAVDAAQDGDTIEVLPCADFGVDKYGKSYATNVAGNITSDSGKVFLKGKSLTIQNHNNASASSADKTTYSATLDSFVIVLKGTTGTVNDYTFKNLCITGKSLISPDTISGSLGTITVHNCYADTDIIISDSYSISDSRNPDGSKLNNGRPIYTECAFIQSPQNGYPGTTDGLYVTNNTIIARNADRHINGGYRIKDLLISGNVFGCPEKSGRFMSYSFVIERMYDGESKFEIKNNKYYSNGTANIAYINTDNSNAFLKMSIHDNEIYDVTYVNENNRKRLLRSADGLPYYISQLANSGAGADFVTYRNYVNGYCDNRVNNAKAGVSGYRVEEQDGHTYGDGHIQLISESTDALIKKYGLKAEDIVFQGHADEFAGGDHDKHTLSSDEYCDRCDDILTALIITCTGLSENESAIFTVKDADANEVCTLSLTGPDAKKAVMGLKAGKYTVSADSWDWAYTNSASITKNVKYLNAISGQDDITFPFEVTKKTGVTVKHGEDSQLNNLAK